MEWWIILPLIAMLGTGALVLGMQAWCVTWFPRGFFHDFFTE